MAVLAQRSPTLGTSDRLEQNAPKHGLVPNFYIGRSFAAKKKDGTRGNSGRSALGAGR